MKQMIHTTTGSDGGKGQGRKDSVRPLVNPTAHKIGTRNDIITRAARDMTASCVSFIVDART